MITNNVIKWVVTKIDSDKKLLPKEGISVLIKVGVNYYTAHIVYSGGAEFHCLSPIEESTEVAIEMVEEWAYINEDHGVIEY